MKNIVNRIDSMEKDLSKLKELIKAVENKDNGLLQPNITYGTVVKARIFDVRFIETVLLADNTTAGNGFNCMVIDLRSGGEILLETKDIDDFLDSYEIVEIVGQFNELFDI